MNPNNPTLMTINLAGLVAWAAQVQVILGFVGAFLAVISGFMLVVINWDKFNQSRGYKFFIKLFRK
jgi:chitinase